MIDKTSKFAYNKEPNTSDIPKEIREWYSKIGSKKSKVKAKAARINGKQGGRPRKVKQFEN